MSRVSASVVVRKMMWLGMMSAVACFGGDCDGNKTILQVQPCTLLTSSYVNLAGSIDEGTTVEAEVSVTSANCDSPLGSTFGVTSSDPSVATVTLVAGTTTVVGVNEQRQTVRISGIKSGTVSLIVDAGRQVGGATIHPATIGQSALLVNRAAGNVAVTITGLPSGTSADVKLVQGTSTIATFAVTRTESSIAVGTYTLTAASVVTATGTFVPTPVSQTVVVGNKQTTNVSVVYKLSTGNLNVIVTGLPGDAGGSMELRFSGVATPVATLTGSRSFVDIAAGLYVLAANTVSIGGINYVPQPATQSVTVGIVPTVSMTVNYVAQVGAIALTISGVAIGDVTVETIGHIPEKFVTTSQTIGGLAPGPHNVVAKTVDAGVYSYDPTPLSQLVTLTSNTTTPVSVVYAAATGAVNVIITGLPTGLDARVQITPRSSSSTIFAELTKSTLVPRVGRGDFQVLASPVTSSGGTVYIPTPLSRLITLTGGVTTDAAVVYAPAVGQNVALSIGGLPTGSQAQLTISGGTLTTPTQVTVSGSAATNVQLAPGDYTVQSSDIVIGHQTFAPVTRMRTLSILANGNAIVLLYAYYLARAAYIVQLQTSIFSDLYGHRTFVNMFTSALLQLVWTWNAANTLALIQMSGPSPFITVSGTRNADGSATLTGSGSAAGFSSVPATFTGTIGDGTPAGNLRASSDGVSNILAHLAGVSDVINSKYQLGQVNAPTGLPNGPIIYTISGTGAPSIP